MSILQCRVQGTGGNGSPPYANIYHVVCSDEDAPGVASALVGVFETFYTDLCDRLALDTQWEVFNRIVDIQQNPPVVYSPTSVILPSTAQAEQAPAQLAVVISWHTNLAGPRYRGRTYIGPLDSGIFDAGLLNPTAQAAFQDEANTLISDIRAIEHTGITPPALSVYSAKYNTAIAIQSATVNRRVDTQRRRN